MRTVLDRKQSEQLVTAKVQAEISQKYPHLPLKQQIKLARQCTKVAMRRVPGGRLILVHKPASRWQQFKEQHIPKWFTRLFPVVYVEAE